MSIPHKIPFILGAICSLILAFRLLVKGKWMLALFPAFLLYAVFDLTAGHFLRPALDLQATRIGAVTDTTAMIWIRTPSRAYLSLAVSDPNGGIQAHSIKTIPKTDFTAYIQIKGLKPDTLYEYTWTDLNSGDPLFPKSILTFKTAPKSSDPKSFTFAYSSCVHPNFPYGIKGIRGFREMKKQAISFLLFLGDLIYSG
jgi:phosphodiesterase/alkaline phosphatase D-like protein